MEPRPIRLGERRHLSSRGAGTGVSALLGLLVVASLATGQERTPLWKFFERETEVTELVDACIALLGLNLEYDRSEVKGTVSVRTEEGLTEQGLWALANRALLTQGLACVQIPGEDALTIVSLEQAKSLARLEDYDLSNVRAGYVRLLVELDNVKAADLTQTVQAVLSKQGGSVAALPDTNALLVSDLAPHVVQALSLIRTLDVPEFPVVVEEVVCKNLSPIALTSMLERIAQARKNVETKPRRGTVVASPEAGSVLVIAPETELSYWRDLVLRFDRKEPVRTVHYAPRRFGVHATAKLVEAVVKDETVRATPGSWRVVEDELTGTLVITATASQHQRIQELIDRLEKSEAARTTFRAFPVRHRGVGDLLTLLQGFLDQGILGAGATAMPLSAAPPEAEGDGPTAPFVAEEQRLRIVEDDDVPPVTLAADEGTNRILAMGEPRLLDELAKLIDTLDVRHSQVLVETLVVGLTDTQTRDLAVELEKVGVHNGVAYLLSTSFAAQPEGVLVDDPLPDVTTTGLEGVVLDPGDFSGVLRAIETLNRGRTLTVPKVLVNNNQEATLDSVFQAPYASTNASVSVATTSLGGTQDAGTSVRVKPQITDGDQLLLDYTVSLSQFVGESADPNLPPPRQENKLTSTVTIPDGFTVVLGGLEIEMEAKASSQVPFLGSIPLVGYLFRSQGTSREKTRFFVFIRASVLRSGSFEDLKYLSREDREAADLDEDWPKLEPRVIR